MFAFWIYEAEAVTFLPRLHNCSTEVDIPCYVYHVMNYPGCGYSEQVDQREDGGGLRLHGDLLQPGVSTIPASSDNLFPPKVEALLDESPGLRTLKTFPVLEETTKYSLM